MCEVPHEEHKSRVHTAAAANCLESVNTPSEQNEVTAWLFRKNKPCESCKKGAIKIWEFEQVLNLFRREKASKAVHEYAEEALTKYQQIYGGVAQLGEHLPCKQGVRSSILLISTK